MAIKKVYNEKTVYVRVDRVIVGKYVQIPDIIVGFYEQLPPEQEGEDSILKFQTKMHFYFQIGTPEFSLFTPESLSEEGMNPIKKVYEYLKTLPQFSDYEDA
jgi:hypothetical protein